VSTLSVGAGNIAGKKTALFTEFDCDIGQIADNHYVQTKLEAERLVLQLRERGIVANIFRVGYLTADSRSLIFQLNPDDSAFVQKLKAFVALGSIPRQALVHSFCPVNEVSDAILRLLPLSALANETHHIDRGITPDEATTVCEHNSKCRPMDEADFYEWFGANLSDQRVAQVAAPILLHEGLLGDEPSTEVVVVSDKTDRLFARLGFSFSPVAPEAVWSMVSAPAH